MLSNITPVYIAASFFLLPISSYGATVGCIVFKVRAVALIVVCLLFSQTPSPEAPYGYKSYSFVRFKMVD